MKVDYSKALQRLRQSDVSTYSSSLFENVGWVYPLEKMVSSASNASSEKAKVLNELKDFSEQQIQNQKSDENNNKTISFTGGEIQLKSSLYSNAESKKSQGELLASLSQKISQQSLEQRFCLHQSSVNKLCLNSQIKVMFVNDVLLDELETTQESLEHTTNEFVPELKTAFSSEVSELFAKMIQAMQLQGSDFVISGIKVKKTQNKEQEHEIDYLQSLYTEINYFRPQLIITLGAVATHKLLESKERLAKVHGQIFHKKIYEHSSTAPLEVKIMPLFHPELLLINPNMKKTAWIDMQKAMKEVGTGVY